MRKDESNPLTADTAAAVDKANQRFYSKFPYPWPPKTFPQLEDPYFETTMLNQSIGDISHEIIPCDADIWVAGCGTNQAVYTALQFPRSHVLGSDVSDASLAICRKSADALGLKNLSLRRESLNDIDYRNHFDYILCTGVIHHNAEPHETLHKIACALRARRVLELMEYNFYHHVFTTGFKNEVRLLSKHARVFGNYAKWQSPNLS